MSCEKNTISFQIKTISNLIKRRIDMYAKEDGIDNATGVHGWVIGYLYENKDRDIFQRDLEEKFHIRRSTVTSILKLMEKNGLITRENVSDDARLKKIVLTETALFIHENIGKNIKKAENELTEGMTEEEINQLSNMLEKMRKNIE